MLYEVMSRGSYSLQYRHRFALIQMTTTQPPIVLVTGGSGFVASHCILRVLHDGYRVRTTVRNPSRIQEVWQALKSGGATDNQLENVEIVVAELQDDDGWTAACRDCSFVLHMASPFPPESPNHDDPAESPSHEDVREEDVIAPAREGTLRVLKAARAAGTVKRVVLTSSTAAIMFGQPERGYQPYTEADWTNINHPAYPVGSYHKSKMLAERAAWDFIAAHDEADGPPMELSVINPVGIYGPVLGGHYSMSVSLVARLLRGEIQSLADVGFGVVDVRDLCDLHIRAMTHPDANGERFIATSPDGHVTLEKVAAVLRRRLGEAASKVPTAKAPNMNVKIVGFLSRDVGGVAALLGRAKDCSPAKAQRMLGWEPRSAEETLVATAESLRRFGALD